MRSWALITGASSGIGRALALELASRGYNLFLTGRDGPSLQQVAAECGQKHHVETAIHVADLADPTAMDGLISALAAGPEDLEFLVNNAGFGVRGEFEKTDLAQELNLLNVHLAATLKLTKALLPKMIERKRGRILNVASVYSFAPVPFQAVYAASKAFLFSFSQSLREELRGSGVSVTALCPGVTRTEFRARAGIEEKNKDAGKSPEAVARIAVEQTLKGKALAVPGLSSRLFVFLARRLPISMVPRVVRLVNRVRGVNE